MPDTPPAAGTDTAPDEPDYSQEEPLQERDPRKWDGGDTEAGQWAAAMSATPAAPRTPPAPPPAG